MAGSLFVTRIKNKRKEKGRETKIKWDIPVFFCLVGAVGAVGHYMALKDYDLMKRILTIFHYIPFI